MAKLATRFPFLAERLISSHEPWESEEIPWTRVKKPLERSRVALITTAGVHHAGQPPFDMRDPDGDPSFRILHGPSIVSDYRITHDYYDHTDADRDINIVLPAQRLMEMAAAGYTGGASERHFSFMGHITGAHIRTLMELRAPEVADMLAEDRVDLVLLTPG